MRDPRALSGGAPLHQLDQSEREPGNQQRLKCDGDEDLHHLPPFALRARAIISSSSLSSSSFKRSDIPSSAEAALAGDPLKNTRTISLSADFLATASDTTGL